MTTHELIREIRETATSKIVLLVADGLGGMPRTPDGLTELETARTPHLDACVQQGTCGLMIPVLPGVTPGSGPGHLALFGYDPLEYRIGRGVLEALGINFPLGPNDVAIRGNFCTLDAEGRIIDRRAGRPSNEQNAAAVAKLRTIHLPGVELFVEPVREHRFVVVLRGEGLGDQVHDTDPQAVGVPPLLAEGTDAPSQKTAALLNQLAAEARRVLADQGPLNGITLRGIARRPAIPQFADIYGLRAAALAVYPMYKGLARLVGMDVLDCGTSLQSQIDTLRRVWTDYDFFFVHFKYTDSTGEDGNFAAKVQMIEQLDAHLPQLLALQPDVLIVTGDHSTPSQLRSHSWHPVPVVLRAATARPDGLREFGERTCLRGGLGIFPAKYLMLLAMAHAMRLGKYGA